MLVSWAIMDHGSWVRVVVLAQSHVTAANANTYANGIALCIMCSKTAMDTGANHATRLNTGQETNEHTREAREPELKRESEVPPCFLVRAESEP
jgi:hypothetical protein